MREMKDSGVAWIGEIPSEWTLVRTKNSYIHKKEIAGENADNFERLALTLNGVIKRSKEDSTGLQPEAFNSYQVLRENELVFKLIDLENIKTSRVGYSPYTGIVSPAYIILQPKKNNESKYGEYFFLSLWQREIFNHMGDDGVRSSLNSNDLLNIPYLSMPSQERDIIVSRLNADCSKINSVIELTRSSIEEYKKLKQSVITEAVTKGIRPNRNMKDSGIEWIGEIPEDWEVKKIKYLFTIKKDIAGQEGYSVLSITQKGIVPKDISSNEGQMAANYSNYQFVKQGYFAMNHMDLLTGWIDISQYDGVTSPDYRVFVINNDVTNYKEYFLYLFQMCYFNRVFYGFGQGVSNYGRWRLQTDKFKNITIPVPPLPEQKEITEYIKVKATEIDSIVSRKERFITELETYKKSLIYEYVTGKKEVV